MKAEDRTSTLLFFLFFGAYIVLAAAFAEERLFADPSDSVFRLVSTKNFLGFGRVADAPLQFFRAPAVLLARAGCSVKAVAFAFNLGIPLAAFAIFLFIYYFNRDSLCALALAMALVVDEAGGFFFPTYLRMLSCMMILACSAFFYITTADTSTFWLKVKKPVNYVLFFFCVYCCAYHQTATSRVGWAQHAPGSRRVQTIYAAI